jgi:hypothetical protein
MNLDGSFIKILLMSMCTQAINNIDLSINKWEREREREKENE